MKKYFLKFLQCPTTYANLNKNTLIPKFNWHGNEKLVTITSRAATMTPKVAELYRLSLVIYLTFVTWIAHFVSQTWLKLLYSTDFHDLCDIT